MWVSSQVVLYVVNPQASGEVLSLAGDVLYVLGCHVAQTPCCKKIFCSYYLQEKVNASVENVNVILALKALPVSARPLTRPAVP